MSAVVPPGVAPGQQLQLRIADGRVVNVVVPPGVGAGQSFQFRVPAAAPPPMQQQPRQTMVVVCPPGAQAGSMIQVRAGNRLVTVQVPVGVGPGQQFQMTV